MTPTWQRRAIFALAVAAVCGAYAGLVSKAAPAGFQADLDQLWFGARTLLEGGNPYDAIGPGKALSWPWKLYYPLPAMLAVVPLAPFPITVARVLFAAVSGVAFA